MASRFLRGRRLGPVVAVGLAALLLGLFLRSALDWTDDRLAVPLDDAWIHYQFARNLSQGQGFSFNPGEPTPGSTAPLWTLLLAAVGLFTDQFLAASLILSAFFLLLAVGLTYGLATELSRRPFLGLLAALGAALTGRLLWAGLAGMETTAFVAASLGAVWLYTRRGLGLWAALLFALAAQLRPEGHALFALVLLDSGWRLLRQDRGAADRAPLAASALKTLGPALLIYAAVSLPYVLFSLSVTGRPLPNTFYAKVGRQHLFSMRTLSETLRMHFRDNPVMFLLALPGLGVAWRRSRPVAAWLLGLPLFTALVVDFTWHHGRYTMPLAPFVMVAGALGAGWLLDRVGQPRRTWAAAALVLLVVAGGVRRLPYWADQLGQNSREVLAIDVALGRWLAENTPPEALVAVDDIGAIGFLSERRILDLNGLISPELWPVLNEETQGLPRNQAATRALSQLRPDHLAIFPLWHYELAINPEVLSPLVTFQVDSRTIIGEREATVYRAEWPYLARNAVTEPTAIFGSAIALADYTLTPPAADQPYLGLTLEWACLAPVEKGYTVFVHVVDEQGTIVAQADRPPVANLAPTDRWLAGDVVRDRLEIPWPADLPAASYELYVGLYLPETGERLPATASTVNGDAVLLDRIELMP